MATTPKKKKRCPDCGKTFVGLGAHRYKAHGVKAKAGTKTPARRRKKKPAPKAADLGLDMLLEEMFPEGIPKGKYADVVAWVDDTLTLAS